MCSHLLLAPLPGAGEKGQSPASSTQCDLQEEQVLMKKCSIEDPRNDGRHCDCAVLEVRVNDDGRQEEKKKEKKEERKKQKWSQRNGGQQ